MSIPSYDRCIEPLLRVLAEHPEGLTTSEAMDRTADQLGITSEERRDLLPSGVYPVYRSRIGWAHDRLKRAGLSQAPRRGIWQITQFGLDLLAKRPAGLGEEEIRELSRVPVSPGRSENSAAGRGADQFAKGAEDGRAVRQQSPEERLDLALEEMRSTVVRDLLESLGRVPPERFESIVLDLLHRMGYGASRSDLTRVGGSGDGGIDGVISLDRLGLEKVYIQAKRWQGTVGRPEIQAFFGALAGQKARKGVFITTSGYSNQAIDFARSVEGIVLVDGERLANLMIDHEVGVGSRLVRVPRIDGDYFEDFAG